MIELLAIAISELPIAEVSIPLAQGTGFPVEVTPSSEGLPGVVKWNQFLGWLMWFGFAGSTAAIMIGGGVWGLSYAAGNSSQSTKGKTYAIGGAAGATVTGLATTIVNSLGSVG